MASPKIIVQAGHQNINNNVDPALHGGVGAPGEVDFTVDVANQLSAQLRQRGFDVIQTDANFNSDPRRTADYNLFIAVHYEADVHNTNGYFVAAPDPSADSVNTESVRIRDAISTQYATLGIPKHNEWENPNTKFYYMWSALSAKTPCVLIECGVGWRVPDDHNLFTNNRGKVIEQIARGICKAFGINYDPTPPTDPCADVKKELATTKDQLAKANTQIASLQGRIDKIKILAS